MRSRSFRYGDLEWEVVADGIGTGAGLAGGHLPEIIRWLVTFRCLSDPQQKKVPGHVGEADLSALDDGELAAALEAALRQQSSG